MDAFLQRFTDKIKGVITGFGVPSGSDLETRILTQAKLVRRSLRPEDDNLAKRLARIESAVRKDIPEKDVDA